MQGQRVLITGASSGIGRATALALAQFGCHLFLLARREERLIELKKEILASHPDLSVDLILGDLNDLSTHQKIETVTLGNVDILINNAGLALGKERVQEAQFSDWEIMLQTNVSANFRMVHLILPWMLKQGQGDIINLSSIAGHYTYQGGAVYCATKHAVNAFTKVLREETCGQNIRVMQMSPGLVDSEFSTVRFHGDKKMADNVYVNMQPLMPEDVARLISFMLIQPRHVVIDEMITTPLQQGSIHTVARKGP